MELAQKAKKNILNYIGYNAPCLNPSTHWKPMLAYQGQRTDGRRDPVIVACTRLKRWEHFLKGTEKQKIFPIASGTAATASHMQWNKVLKSVNCLRSKYLNFNGYKLIYNMVLECDRFEIYQRKIEVSYLFLYGCMSLLKE